MATEAAAASASKEGEAEDAVGEGQKNQRHREDAGDINEQLAQKDKDLVRRQ